MKKILIVLMCAMVFTGCGAEKKVDSKADTIELAEETYEEESAWPKTEEFLDGEKYEFDKKNWAYYEVKKSTSGVEAQVSIYCEEDSYPLGETCFSLLQSELGMHFENFNIGYDSGEDTILYAVVGGKAISEEMPEVNEEDVKDECREKAIQFYDTCLEYLKENAPAISETKNGETQQQTVVSEQVRTATIGQQNAFASAKQYLELLPFSYAGLIEQLEYEGYSTEDATYAADNCGADWNEQAVKSAKSYLDMMPFSREELIGQLEYEGFTHEQAVYGVEQNGY